ncbi:hypothetical protein SmJEL517_g02071 [Synchytrium microbalum]|uniref:Thioesterase domain-containing protein n=1 Tax=Synchytrium microbalum TaxID=1806994 RepID=A0A507CD19_9FUNG|nr:uncharacterized protein SmJEL517_g02071 [Synchytrium microbalum]TPX35455.1 hypothetical protein SmJEL517_g02071 [Synchytrium microbalum]
MSTSRAAIEVVRETWKSLLNAGGLDTRLLSGFKVLDAKADEGIIKAEMLVEQIHLNRAHGLHGGCICTLVDIAGSLAVSARRQSSGFTGVSTDIHVSFLNGGKLGDRLLIESICSKAGKTLAFTSTKISVGDKLLATGSHTKYIGAAIKPVSKPLE